MRYRLSSKRYTSVSIRGGYAIRAMPITNKSGDISIYFLDLNLFAEGAATYDFVQILGVISGLITCIGGIHGLYKWIRSKIAPKDPPFSYFSHLLTKKTWNYHELAEELKVAPDVSKKLLIAFGFSWDKSTQLYQHTKNTEILLKALSAYPRLKNRHISL